MPAMPDDAAVLEQWLSERAGEQGAPAGPPRGDKRALQQTVTQNAGGASPGTGCASSDHNSRARALNELQVALDLPHAPLRVECFDMSHLQGTDYVGSMVVMEDALPKKSDYRRFRIKGRRATTTSRRWRRC